MGAPIVSIVLAVCICICSGIISITCNASIIIIIITTTITRLVFVGIIAVSSMTIFCQEGTPIWAYAYLLVL